MIEMSEQVYFSVGSEKNIKLTTVEDIDIFKALLDARRSDWLKSGAVTKLLTMLPYFFCFVMKLL